MNLTHRSRRLASRIVLGGMAAAGIVTVTPATSSASTAGRSAQLAAPPPLTTFGNNGALVKAKGSSWTLSVNYSASGSTNQLGIVLTRTVTTGGKGFEIHTWTFPATTSSALKKSPTNTWILKTSNVLANVDLTFTQTGKTAGICASGSETIYTGTLKGSVSFKTELGPTVTGTSWTVAGSRPSIVVSSLCRAKVNPCTPLESFVSGTAAPIGAGSNGTLQGLKLDDVTVATTSNVPQLKGTTRGDVALLSGGTFTFNLTKRVVTVMSSSAGIVTGSATISGGSFSSSSTSCPYAGKTYKQMNAIDSKAHLASRSGQQLEGHTILTPTIKVSSSTSTAFWTDQTDTPE